MNGGELYGLMERMVGEGRAVGWEELRRCEERMVEFREAGVV